MIATLPALPDTLRQSSLLRAGGFRIYSNLHDARHLAGLLDEALRRFSYATETHVTRSSGGEIRGGNPARRFLSVAGGPRQTSWYHAAVVNTFIAREASVPVAPTGDAGTFSYYCRPGDFLGIHRDIVTCDLAVITCLYESAPLASSGGMMCFYPKRLSEPVSSIRQTPGVGGLKLRLRVGDTMLLWGGVVPHAILPVKAGQTRVVSILCYRGQL